MVHKNTNISIVVTGNRVETLGYRSITFERPKNFTYDAGDWIDIQFAGKELKGGKTYSLSSSPTDPNLMITFKDGLSEIKRALATAQPGEKLHITQYGNDYKFTLKPNHTSTLIAGGVGVAPFRSMIAEMSAHRDAHEVHLIYMNKDSYFLFQEELNAWQKQLVGVTVSYIVTSELKRKDRSKVLLNTISSLDHSFYIAGPEGMVETTEHLLIDHGVEIENIKIDSFGGY